MKRILSTLIFFYAITFLFTSDAYACYAPHFPWEVVFEDTNRIFYMTPDYIDLQEWPPDQRKMLEERMSIKSGLYYNKTPLVNIYYVDEYFHSGLYFSDDGVYFAEINWFGYADAVRFFKNGSLIKSYPANDLLKDRSKGWSTTAGFLWIEEREFDQQKNALTVVTKDERTYVFDITTGAITSRSGGGVSTPIIIGVITLSAITATVMYLRKTKK